MRSYLSEKGYMINLLFIGDVACFEGLEFLKSNFEFLKEQYQANFIVVNGENICNGKGITEREAKELFDLGVNVITTGNHIWDNWMSKPLLKSEPLVIRPMNYPPGNIGRGYAVVQHESGINIAVLQLQGRTFMQTIDCPFRCADAVLENLQKRNDIGVVIVDFHAETTGEKLAMAWHLDGRVSALIGTHTHIQTADAQILPNGTAYITDAGMTGPYDSVLGMDKHVALNRYIYQVAHKFAPAKNDVRICGVSVKIDKTSGNAIHIERITYPKFENSVTLE